MRHFEGNAGLDESLVHAVDGLLDQALHTLRTGIEGAVCCEYTSPTRAIGAVLRKYRSHCSAIRTGPRSLSARAGRARAGDHVEPWPQSVGHAVRTQRRISAAVFTESFQRCASSMPMLKMPPIGFVARTWREIPCRSSRWPTAASTPLRACRSAKSVGASSPIVFMSRSLVAPPPEFAMKRASGLILRISVSHKCHSSNSRCCCHTM